MSGEPTIVAQTAPYATAADAAFVDVSQAGRTRRRTRKAIDYGREQDFSDDAFEDIADKEPGISPAAFRKPRPSTSRKKKGGDDEDDTSLDYGSGSAPAYQSVGPRYVEKGYDPSLPPIRERYHFMPEFEDDGSHKVECILGRRPIQDQEKPLPDEDDSQADGNADESNQSGEDSEQDESDNEEESDDGESPRKRGRPRKSTRKSKKAKGKSTRKNPSPARAATRGMLPKTVEYEYLIKYKGRSYLHLEWKTASDLESMNKSAKTLYRRFLKKLEAGLDENLEDPSFDPSFTEPGRILDEKEEELYIELPDEELLKWVKEREKELAEEAGEMEEVEEAKPATVPQALQAPETAGITNGTEDGKNVSEVEAGKFSQ